MPERVSAPAHAKVNLVLEVLGKRDDGYHEIDTVLQEVELADIVSAELSEAWSIEITGPRGAGTPADHTNLALKAARLLGGRTPGSSPCRIVLEKHIPAAGGLGGGAADAAATLRCLQRLWPGVAHPAVEEVAREVGSDEAFFLVGGTARATGRGEVVTALPPLPPHEVVLFVPHQTIERKTPRMFAAIDAHDFDSGSVAAQFAAGPPLHLGSNAVFNAFERVAFDVFPWLAELWADLEQRTGEAVRLCGAGPCMFWIGPDGGARVAGLARDAGCEVILTRTVAR